MNKLIQMVKYTPTWIWFSCSLCALTKRHKRSLIQFYPHFAEYLFSWEQELLVQGTIHDLKNKENCNLASWLPLLRDNVHTQFLNWLFSMFYTNIYLNVWRCSLIRIGSSRLIRMSWMRSSPRRRVGENISQGSERKCSANKWHIV